MKKTKIVCTIGPASNDEETLREMLLAGMNVARFNFSHGTHEEHDASIRKFHRVRDELGIPAAVMLDTKGPEIRVKDFEGGSAMLKDGEPFTLTTLDTAGNDSIVSVTYKDIPKYMSCGDQILIDDGKVVLRVTETDENSVHTIVIHGGKVKAHKGVNLPDVDYKMEYMSDRDRSDILFGIEHGVDYVAASFVRTRDDVLAIRRLLDENGGSEIQIISKIESTQGVDDFEEILAVSDGIMVARGDMGVELAYERLPGIQKRFIKRCVQSGKIVITATQMLESMMESPTPTRAEITDVANAVYDGTSAVMLSGESAAGRYPVEAVRAMARICVQAEDDDAKAYRTDRIWHEMNVRDTTNAIAHAACTLANDINATAILAATNTGFTAARMSKFRPDITVIGATPNLKSYHRMALMWGVEPIIDDYKESVDDLFESFTIKAKKTGLIKSGDKIVITAGLPAEPNSRSNMIRVMTVPGE